MLSDDVYRSKLSTVFNNLLAATRPLADVADITHDQTSQFVRLSMLPTARGACPVEIMIRADQLYDIQIGTEFYEDCPIERLDHFDAVIAAIISGDVIQRRAISTATGTQRSIETIVTLPDGKTWRKRHVHGPAPANTEAATVFLDRRFVPYRR